jgi:hypothetical protein
MSAVNTPPSPSRPTRVEAFRGSSQEGSASQQSRTTHTTWDYLALGLAVPRDQRRN